MTSPDGGQHPVERLLDDIFADVDRSGSPGMAVGIAQRGRCMYRKGFGLASIEHGVANGPTTRMRIGSTTKHFTCLAVLLLAEDGKLDLDAPVRHYIPELPVLGREPTLRQLMTHTGGTRDYLDLAFIANGSAVQPRGAPLAAQTRQTQLNFAPAEKMIYCNGGYHLLSVCVDRTSGMTFEAFLNERIFVPMGMVDTLAAPDDMALRRGMATLHVPTPSGGYRRGLFPSEEVRGEGSIVSTVDDLLRWAAHLRAPEKRIGSAASWRQMFTPATLADGTSTHYGLGLMLHDYRGVGVIHHSGSVIGGTSQMLIVPEHELDIVILANGSAASPMLKANRVVDALLQHRGLAAPEAIAAIADYAPLVGARYRSASSGMVVEFGTVVLPERHDEQLGLSILGSPAISLVRDGDALTVPVHLTSLGPLTLSLSTLAPDADAPAHLDVKEGSMTERFDRLPAAVPNFEDPELMLALEGGYRSSDLDADASFVQDAGAAWTFRIVGAVGTVVYRLRPYAADLLRADSTDPAVPVVAMVTIERRAAVIALLIDTPRSRRLRFERLR